MDPTLSQDANSSDWTEVVSHTLYCSSAVELGISEILDTYFFLSGNIFSHISLPISSPFLYYFIQGCNWSLLNESCVFHYSKFSSSLLQNFSSSQKLDTLCVSWKDEQSIHSAFLICTSPRQSVSFSQDFMLGKHQAFSPTAGYCSEDIWGKSSKRIWGIIFVTIWSPFWNPQEYLK